MYEVLVYVYESYWCGDDCPERELLARKLVAAGFEREDIQRALQWLDGLRGAARARHDDARAAPTVAHEPAHLPARGTAPLRLYVPLEVDGLGVDGVAYLSFLEARGALAPELREVVIERALAMHDGESPVGLDDIKLIVLMVYWSFGVEADVLVLDELCDDTARRLPH